MWKLRSYLKKYKKQVIIGPICKLLEAVFELLVPLVMASIIDVGVKNNNIKYVLSMGGLIVLLGTVGLTLALICQKSAAIASQGFGTIVRNEMFRHINRLSYRDLDSLGTNSLITRITNDVNQMQLAVAMLIRLVIRAPFIIIGSTIMAMIIDLKMSFIFALIIPLVTLVLYFVMGASIPYYQKRQKKLDEVSLVTRENLEGARVIRAFSKQNTENERFQQVSQDVTEVAVKVGKISAILNPATFTIINLGIIAILWFGGLQVDIGNLTQGQIIAMVNYTTQIALTLIVVANVVIIFTKASASAKRINEVLDLEPDIKEGQADKVFDESRKGEAKIFFDHVSFSYQGSDKYVLEDISLEIKKGETIGIIGGTGAGKSTLINLIPRFYDVDEGSVYVDGMNVKDYKFHALRGQFGIVPQKAVLFEGTILENMRWAKKDADIDEVIQALDTAQALAFVQAKEEKLDTKIVQGGKNLSGGQRQRLTIARALVGNPQILILDDSASALDYATDAKLRKALGAYEKEMTVLLVSQRVNSLKHADKILVLKEGRSVGVGTHKQLFEECDEYREICLSQLSEEEVLR